ncbi:replication initiation protein [Helicobacter ailurogastricus]|uniref:replication initiation protein n=1 Tax=Helicobacter ailurogastricus TaxID=1578720 RepID=UPI0022BCD059|nr:replication initiation protein [Helicobacter ailurogastricus]GLH58638.1 hypothetical protein NHP214376_14330 [Helicobacter ailurogastricus]GLH60094.1 hypothetical protein NHP214377_13660 [Helicobacter ailurogastricus]
MDKENPSYRHVRNLKYDIDALTVLEHETDKSTELYEFILAQKTEKLKEIVNFILEHENEWNQDDIGELDTSKEAIKNVKHFIGIMEGMERLKTTNTRPDIHKSCDDGIKDCIGHICTAITTWMEGWTEYAKRENAPLYNPSTMQTTPTPPTEVAQIAPTEVDNPKNAPQISLPAHIPQEVAKETLQQAPQLDSVSKTPKAFNKTENLTGEDIEYTPVLAKNTRIANPKQVVMHNNIYKVNLGMLGELENNLFFSLFNRLKDKKDTVIRFTPQELKALAGDPHMPNTRLYKVTLDLFNNIAGANFDLIKYLPNDNIRRSRVMLFRVFALEYDKQKNVKHLDIQINDPYFTYLLNELEANFTTMQLQTFLDLSGKYSKNLYRLLERFKHATDKKGIFEVNIYKSNLQGFRDFMGIPKSLRMGDIDRQVLNPTLKQLTQKTTKLNAFEPPYKSIKVIKNKARERGARVLGYTFEVVINPAMQELEKALEKAKAPRLKYFSKKDIKILNDCLHKCVDVVLKDKEGNPFSIPLATIEQIIPTQDSKALIVQFRAPPLIDGQLEVMQLYQGYTKYCQVCGHDYFTLAFAHIQDLLALIEKTQERFNTLKTHETQIPPTINATQKAQIQSAHGMLAPFFENNTPQHSFTEVKLIDTILSKTNTEVIALFEIINGTDKDFYTAQEHKTYIEKFKNDGQEYFTHVFSNPQDFLENFGNNAKPPHTIGAITPKDKGKKGITHTFNTAQLITYIKSPNTKRVGALFKLIDPSPKDLENAKLYQKKIYIDYFKKSVPKCDAPDYFVYVFESMQELHQWIEKYSQKAIA